MKIINKIINKPILFFTLNLFVISSLSILVVCIPIKQNIIINMLFSMLFFLSLCMDYSFLKINRNKVINYSKRKKILSAILCFLIIDIFAKFVDTGLIRDLSFSMYYNFCGLLFAFMFNAGLIQNLFFSMYYRFFGLMFAFMLLLFGALAYKKFPYLSKILYCAGIIILFIVNVLSILNLFFFIRLIKESLLMLL